MMVENTSSIFVISSIVMILSVVYNSASERGNSRVLLFTISDHYYKERG